jgi:hypothetical protein
VGCLGLSRGPNLGCGAIPQSSALLAWGTLRLIVYEGEDFKRKCPSPAETEDGQAKHVIMIMASMTIHRKKGHCWYFERGTLRDKFA